MESGIALLALLVAGYALVAARLNRLSIGPALFFVVVGALVARVPGVTAVPGSLAGAPLAIIEITLALILFVDASTIDWRRLREEAGLVIRLLGIGLLLSIALGTLLAGALFPEMPAGVILLLGAALAPTDAALGQPVVTNRVVPVRIRRLLNAESGLNDGTATPFVLLAVSLIASEFGATGDWLGAAVSEAVIGLLTGCVVGGAGGWLLVRAERSGWTSRTSRQLAVVALAVGAYAASVALGGNGFIAAFVGGLAFGAASHRAEEGAEVFAEATGSLLSIVVWVLAGAVFVGPVLDMGLDARVILYAILSRQCSMLSVAISLVGARLRPERCLRRLVQPHGLAHRVRIYAEARGRVYDRHRRGRHRLDHPVRRSTACWPDRSLRGTAGASRLHWRAC
jgi:NhaP-type Na+/H+ or K+/H+ antiporter